MKFLKDFGALVAIALAALGGAMSYGKISQTVDQHGKDIDSLKAITSEIKESLDRLEGALGTKPTKK